MTKPPIMTEEISPEEQAVAKILDDMLHGLDFSTKETILRIVTQTKDLLATTEVEIKVRYAQLRVLRYFEARLQSIHREAAAQYQAIVGAGAYPTFEDANASRTAGSGSPPV